MNTQERLQKAREELELFKQNVQEDTRIDMEDYTRRLADLRIGQQSDPSFDKMDLSRTMGIGGDSAVAMMFGQLNIEARIQALEAQAAREAAMVQVPPQQIVAPPAGAAPPPDVQAAPVQKLGLGRRIKNWFKRTFSHKTADAPAPVQAAPVQVQANPVQVQDDQAQGTGDCSPAIPFIDQVQVPSRLGEVQRFQKPSNPDPDAPDAIVTRAELEMMRQSGARGADGDFLANRALPMFAPAMNEIKDKFEALEQTPGFSFDTAVQGMKTFNIGVGIVKVNEATVAMASKALEMMQQYLQTGHIQEYIRMIYASVDKVLVDNVKSARGPDALPNDADFDDHVMQILPTRGLDCFRSQSIRADTSRGNRTFAIECSKLMCKMAHVEKFCASSSDPEVVALFQPLITQIHALEAIISQIGAQVRAARLAEINGGAAGAGNPPPPPAADPPSA